MEIETKNSENRSETKIITPFGNNLPMPKRPLATSVLRRPEFSSSRGEGKKLVVGKNIKLSGDIDVCESLIVEGQLEANLKDALLIEISETGHFKGTAEVDEAHISGYFDGNLKVKKVLYLYSQGRISGNIQYNSLVVEPGGVVQGTLKHLESK
jgi:cytoskeletal protein CcmA (bactofilin family)